MADPWIVRLVIFCAGAIVGAVVVTVIDVVAIRREFTKGSSHG